LGKYKRIEVHAYRRRVTIISGEWPREVFDAQPAQTDDAVLVNDADLCEPVAPDSREGQMILVEAVRSLERRLSPEARATIYSRQDTLAPNRSHLNRFYLTWQYFYHSICPRVLRFARKVK